jgi:hypothetical protein
MQALIKKDRSKEGGRQRHREQPGKALGTSQPAARWWLFTRKGEEGQPLLALHPANNDIYQGSNILG